MSLAPFRCDRLWTDARLLTMAGGATTVIERGIVAATGSRVVYAGAAADAPRGLEAATTVSCEGRLITPGFVDAHTHLVFAGSRVEEIARRHAGVSYETLARAGGGIRSTVRATRAASTETLTALALRRLDALLADGVTTVEIKSGYGLDLDTERRQLAVARSLATQRRVRVITTGLAAHTVPPEWAHDRDGYVRLVCDTILPVLVREGLVDRVDGFCEGVAFTPEEIARVFTVARDLGLPRTLHADQRADGGGAALAAAFGAQSADHLEYSSDAGIRALAASGTVAVLLPGAYYVLRESQVPPVEACRRHGVPMALATDLNPGTSPLLSLRLAMNLAATLFGLTVEECLAGVTRHAARALGLADETGTIEPGKACDLAIWDVEHPAELVYTMGGDLLHARIWGGA